MTLLFATLHDDYEFAGEEFHLRLGEWFERCSIAIAGCLEGSGICYLEGQFIIGERALVAVLVQEAHGDEGKVVAIGIQQHVVLMVQPSTMQAIGSWSGVSTLNFSCAGSPAVRFTSSPTFSPYWL